MPISFTLLLILVSASNAENAETLWGFIGRYWPGVTPQTIPSSTTWSATPSTISATSCCRRSTSAIAGETERAALTDLRDALSQLPPDTAAGENPGGRLRGRPPRRPSSTHRQGKTKDGKPGVSLEWFNMLYQVLLGQEKGPRFGSFVAVYGLANTVDMIDGALARSA